MNHIGVMHVTDCLDAGGAERVAVNLVNLLPREQYVAHLCTTRRDGPLADLVAEDVKWLRLARKRRFDARALRRFTSYVWQHQIRILHAHGSSIFIAAMASLFPPHPAVVWHDHYGRYKFEDRPVWLYRLAARRVSGVIAVNQPLAEWARRQLRMPVGRVWYIPNLVYEVKSNGESPGVPGKPGGRIACVANFRSQKDHLTLVRAMALVLREEPAAHLLLVGVENDLDYLNLVRKEVALHGLGQSVSFLGQRHDVSTVLRACDIGVLSSASEGLPLSLLEYGLAGLPAVATEVGQCAEVLDEGKAGILVPPAAPGKLAEALLALLRSPERRKSLGERFRGRVQKVYGPGPVIQQICQVYDAVVSSNG